MFGNNSLTPTGSLSKFFEAVKEEVKNLFLSVLGLDCLHLGILLHYFIELIS